MAGETAQQAFERERRARLAYVLARYLRENRGSARWEHRQPGAGHGVDAHEVGWSVAVDSAAFWSLFSRVSEERGWR